MSFETVRQLALELPGIEEGTSYGTPAFKVRGKLVARLREDGETLVVKIDFSDRDLLMQADPDTFFVTDHYVGYPMMLVRLSSVRREQLRILLEDAWRGEAPKRLVSAHDAES
ncbi:MmcQ/YjbR family DNA-binding protein [Archangium lansingense]|uniref:MmcQ/YjbR family DNA-binding protein n=1 Tax=Archangium lansingense TaxID=2995310 RepID=A0ABT4A643_9BACT|nr:MmcQ/YjbR family DNA-binding protein [Archangium lansinium]MCY1077123.1 MmcQ/YjbR family DNA-binding protein [Archangium lansinium]